MSEEDGDYQVDALDAPYNGVPSSFILELVERASDRFLNRLDALDTILIGLLAAVLAIGGLATDKYEEMGAGLSWFAASFLISAIGLSAGNLFKRPLDAPHPLRAMIGLADGGEEALVNLIAELAENWQSNQWLRPLKTATAAVSLALLTGGSLVAVHEKMVEYRHETGSSNGSTQRQQQASRGSQAPTKRVWYL